MKKDTLNALHIIPEEYELEHYMSRNYPFCEMVDAERRFLHGLIRYYEPENIIEVGVSRGGSTVNILNSIMDRPDSRLTGVDIAEVYYGDNTTPVGEVARQAYPVLPEGKWDLHTGRDPVEIVDGIGRKFDFAVLDTSHVMPIEPMNFLTILPHLNDGAIVVMHDVSSFFQLSQEHFFAPRMLFSSVAAPKLTPKPYDFLYKGCTIPNIAAFQVTPDTRKYVGNLLDGLVLPWRLQYPPEMVAKFAAYFAKHYSPQFAESFERIAETQAKTGSGFWNKIADWIGGSRFCIYGFSGFGKTALKELNRLNKTPDFILDNYKPTGEVRVDDISADICRPADKLKRDGTKILVAVFDSDVIYKQLDDLGFEYGRDYMRLTEFYGM